jgi:light-regulated signal transduction histidine kinase (bacteriophytochrome)
MTVGLINYHGRVASIGTVKDITERKRMEEALRTAYDELEMRVGERTAELAEANELLRTEISERKRVEEERERWMAELARSNAELEQFAYVASHDLKEPLRMVSSFAQLLKKRYKGRLGKDADEFIAYIVEGIIRMQAIINDLLAYSRVGTQGKPFQPTDCESVLNQVMVNLKVAIEQSGAIITHDPLPTITADTSQMIQLLQNLISNAIKFRSKELPRIHIRTEKKRNEWFFSVQDNGIGIAPEFFEHLFQIFQRGHPASEYPGTGIGLATCKKIVERHGGKIWAESVESRGSTFYFTIPLRN